MGVVRSTIAVLTALFVCPSSLMAASDFGIEGLIDMPTARMSPDGYFSATISRQSMVDIYNVTYQATPWFETTFRYSILNPTGAWGDMKDRSYEAKIRLLKEGNIIPQVAVGIRDILGTGVWNGEYLVASKKWRHLDVTLGLGWGRFAERAAFSNPLIVLDDRFGTRTAATGGALGGLIRGVSFFRGEKVGLLAGLAYEIPRQRIRLLAEYNPDEYDRERNRSANEQIKPWSVGVEWEPVRDIQLSFSHQQGTQLGFNISFRLDAKKILERKMSRPRYSASETRARSKAPEHLNLSSPYDRILYDIERSGLRMDRASIDPDSSTAVIEIRNPTYALTADAIHRALTLAEAHLPQGIHTVSVVVTEHDMRVATVDYERVDPTMRAYPSIKERRISIRAPRSIKQPTNETVYHVPSVGIGADLSARVQLMDPDAPLRHQVYAKITGHLGLWKGWDIYGIYAQNITNNFSTQRKSDSYLPRVRSNINEYLVHGETGLDALYIEKRGGMGSNIFYSTYAGVLEEMFSGAGAEILYQPFRSRWAVGVNWNQVFQREYDKKFGLKDYDTQTGHLSIYYASPFHDFDIALHMGRYLAGDKGITYETRRTFDNGFAIGAFVTRTNVPAALFGEGSFDKGLYFQIPFNAMLPGNTRRTYSTFLHSLERDGGRRLEGFGSRIWWNRRAARYDALDRHRTRMVPL